MKSLILKCFSIMLLAAVMGGWLAPSFADAAENNLVNITLEAESEQGEEAMHLPTVRHWKKS